MAVHVPGRFAVQAVSRHPRLGRDYDPVAHKYRDEYLKPRRYGITVDAFPGKRLRVPKQDQQLPPGGDPDSIQDIWDLLAPPGTTGFQFSITGQPDRTGIHGPRPHEFTATTTTRLVALSGVFHENRNDNAWNWRIDVPGPGTYHVSVMTLNKSGPKTPRIHRIELRDQLIVSIGDSAASGQGNPDVPGAPKGFDPDLEWWEAFILPVALFKLSKEALRWSFDKLKKNATTLARAGGMTIEMDPDPVWLEPRAYRSLRSSHAHAARLLEDRAKGTVVTFLPFGRTGSDIENGLLGPRKTDGRSDDGWIGDIGQVQEVARTVGKRQIDALLIYVGVNDMGVAARLGELISGDNPLAGGGSDADNRAAVKARGEARLAEIPDKLDDLAAALRTLNVRQIYLTEYPTALFDRAGGAVGGGCGVFTSAFDLDLTHTDAELIKSLAVRLNGVLEAEARRHGWFFISGIADGFRGHGYCTDKGRMFIQAEESLGLQGDTEGTIHPNPEGVQVIAGCVRRSVKTNTIDVPRPGEAPRPDPVHV